MLPLSRRPREFTSRRRNIIRVKIPRGLPRGFLFAIKYGKTAEIALRQAKQFVVITIDDNGPGIPDVEKEKVFDPFYRGERSRSRETGGIGLGLALVKNVLRNHGGTIVLENREPVGLRVIVQLSTAS